MSTLKMVGLSLLALIGLFLIVGIFAPKDFSVERTTVIEAEPEQVFAVINDFSTWDDWSPWRESDPTVEVTLGDITKGKGATYSWVSEESGAGSQTITASNPPQGIETEIEFDGSGTAQSNMKLEPAEKGTKVSWDIAYSIPYPFNTMALFQGGTTEIEESFDKGLALLNQYVMENTASSPNYTFTEVDLPARHYLMHREEVNISDMEEWLPTHLSRLAQAMGEANIAMQGTVTGLFFNWDEESGQADAAVAISAPADATLKGFTTFDLPAGKAISVDYYGTYEGTGEAHQAIDAYIREKGLTATTPAIEEYVTDPSTEPDQSKWLTRIIYPLRG